VTRGNRITSEFQLPAQPSDDVDIRNVEALGNGQSIETWEPAEPFTIGQELNEYLFFPR